MSGPFSVLSMVWFIRVIFRSENVLRMVWFIRAILFFVHGLVYQGYFLFCDWSGLSGLFSVLHIMIMVWFIRAGLCETCPMYV